MIFSPKKAPAQQYHPHWMHLQKSPELPLFTGALGIFVFQILTRIKQNFDSSRVAPRLTALLLVQFIRKEITKMRLI